MMPPIPNTQREAILRHNIDELLHTLGSTPVAYRYTTPSSGARVTGLSRLAALPYTMLALEEHLFTPLTGRRSERVG